MAVFRGETQFKERFMRDQRMTCANKFNFTDKFQCYASQQVNMFCDCAIH